MKNVYKKKKNKKIGGRFKSNLKHHLHVQFSSMSSAKAKSKL